MKIEFFDSHEAAIRRLDEAMKAADARVVAWQAALRPGDYILSIVEDGLVVFGEVLEGYQEPHLKHYRFCRCYSVAWAPKPKEDCPRRLPVVQIRGRLYYQDDRLQEFRAVDDPCDRVPFEVMLWALAILGKWPA